MSEVTVKDVALKAVELAEASPEFVYEPTRDEEGYLNDCSYIHYDEQGGPTGGCLYGQALLALGFTPENIADYEGDRVTAPLTGLLYVDDTDQPLVVAMEESQRLQDTDSPWSDAIKPVKDALAEVAA